MAYDDLRRRLERLSAGHPSSPQYGKLEYGEGREYEEGREYGERDYEALGESGETEHAAGAGAEQAADEQDRLGGRGGEPGRRGQQPASRPGPGHPAGWRPGDAGRRPDGGPAGGRAGTREPYRPWFTTGESPEPWFTSEPGAD
jgi:hypothetical protein